MKQKTKAKPTYYSFIAWNFIIGHYKNKAFICDILPLPLENIMTVLVFIGQKAVEKGI